MQVLDEGKVANVVNEKETLKGNFEAFKKLNGAKLGEQKGQC